MTRSGPSRYAESVLLERGWENGTTLENEVALRLSRWGWKPSEVRQQYQVGSYRLDFAWPAIKLALEVDGWWHRSPEGAAKDAERDAWLRSQGWVVLRIDDRYGADNNLFDQVARVSEIAHKLEAR